MAYIVMSRSAVVHGRAKQFGPYRYLAIVELDPAWAAANPGCEPKMISMRARGVKRIVRESGSLWAGGTTNRSEYVRLQDEYQSEAERLNLKELVDDWEPAR